MTGSSGRARTRGGSFIPGCVITARLLGLFQMEHEKGGDAKLICVVENDPLWKAVHDLNELPESLLDEIKHFFEVYKMLEPDKKTTAIGYAGQSEAMKEVRAAKEGYRSS